MRFPILLATMLLANMAFGQTTNPVKWSFEVIATADHEYDIAFTADIEKGWYIYSQYLASDDGPVRTSFTYKSPESMELIGKNEEKGNKKEMFDSLFDMVVIKYSGRTKFIQHVKTIGDVKNISGFVTFMTCDEEKCLPPVDVPFELALPK